MIRRPERHWGLARLAGLVLRIVLVSVFLSVPAWLALRHFAAIEPWMLPLHRLQSAPAPAGGGVVLGPYPGDGRLAQLGQQGTGMVVSLLRPTVVYEASLIDHEREAAGRIGLGFANLPLDAAEPATGPRNAASLRALRALAAHQQGHGLYVHDYMGGERVQMALAALAGRPARP